MGVQLTGAANVTVDDTATQLSTAVAGREALVFEHISGSQVYYGDANTDDSSGEWVLSSTAGTRVVIDRDSFGEVAVCSAWFGRCASGGSAVVHVGFVRQ